MQKIESNGGPTQYYDFPDGAITLNDLIEYKEMDFHRGNVFKACWRWGEKAGTDFLYDTRKIVYSGCRIYMKLAGVESLRNYLQELLDDPQFQTRSKDEPTYKEIVLVDDPYACQPVGGVFTGDPNLKQWWTT